MRKLAGFLLLLALAGCASAGKPFKPLGGVSKDKAVVYLYRPSCMPYLRKPDVYLNNKKIIELANETYYPLSLPEGKYRVKVDWPDDTFIKDATVEFPVKAGESYYLRVDSGGTLGSVFMVGGTAIMTMNSNSAIRLESKKRALSELNSCSLAKQATKRSYK